MTLQIRIRDRSRLGEVERVLRGMMEGLKVQVRVGGVDARGWVGVSVCGEDERVALRFLEENVGFCPVSLDSAGKFSVFRGVVTGLSGSRSELSVDVGVSLPEPVDVVVPLWRLQARLGDGRKLALGKFVELFGFCEDLPLYVRVVRADVDNKSLDGELSERQLGQYGVWVRSLLDRLLVLGASVVEVNRAVRAAGVYRDVVGVESLGVFEHAVVCKLGTDAVGLVPKLGRVLAGSSLSVFSPRRVVGFLGEGWLSAVSEWPYRV